MVQQAVLYIRSSKDRAEMGVPAQRHELRTFAKSRGYAVTGEFKDMEISGSLDETSRPGLRDLLTAMRDPAREWSVILALDTSRIARDQMLALYVTREAEKHDVEIQYAMMPVDGGSVMGEMMLGMMRSFDRFHAAMSAEKGRGGLVANVVQGFRAGGAAPFGYRLKHTETGGTRGGVPVRKSTLVQDASEAPRVKAFLKARAAGLTRTEAAKRAKLDKAAATLIGIERNALTYAGHTVWNQREKVKPTREDPRKTMRRRPREEWHISDQPTHAPVITRAEAERILALHSELKLRPVRVSKPDDFILSGLLFTPDGVQWHGDAHNAAYRAGSKGKRVNAPFIEGQILFYVAADFMDRKFLARAIAEARHMAEGIEADPAALDTEIRRTQCKLDNLVTLVSETADRSLVIRIRELEARVDTLRRDRAAWADRQALKEQLMAVSEDEMRRLLTATAIKLRGDAPEVLDMIGYQDAERMKPSELRRVLTTMVERVELEPKTLKFAIHYRLPATRARVASPRGFEPRLPP